VAEVMAKADEAIDLIDNLDDNDRAAHYERSEEHFKQLRNYARITNAVRDEATKRLMKERRATQHIFIGIIIAGVGAIAARGDAALDQELVGTAADDQQ